jgi:type II secretory pathway pseudopilin PulG
LGQRGRPSGFTLVEVMIVIGLLVLLVIAGIGATTAMQMSSRRLSDHTSARAAVQARLQAVRAASYKPPNFPFTAGVVYLTNDASIYLDKTGEKFLVSGKVTTKIEPVTTGHLVTVSGRFPIGKRVVSVELSSVVNKFSGGQQ